MVQILYAHNFVEKMDLRDQKVEKVFCKEEECLLYSGDIDIARSLVAAGTVFRLLLVWDSSTGNILQKLKGHTGKSKTEGLPWPE